MCPYILQLLICPNSTEWKFDFSNNDNCPIACQNYSHTKMPLILMTKKTIQIYRLLLGYGRHLLRFHAQFLVSISLKWRCYSNLTKKKNKKKSHLQKSMSKSETYITMQLTVKSNYNITDFNYNKYSCIFVLNKVIVINLPPHFNSKVNESLRNKKKKKPLPIDL